MLAVGVPVLALEGLARCLPFSAGSHQWRVSDVVVCRPDSTQRGWSASGFLSSLLGEWTRPRGR